MKNSQHFCRLEKKHVDEKFQHLMQEEREVKGRGNETGSVTVPVPGTGKIFAC